MSANFLPEIHNVTHTEPFRYWCQKVLPLVYDDSLSYYELLCKVVNYLNHTMADVNTLTDDVRDIATAYTQLEEYVNNYFDNLNVQTEIDNKLDQMAEDGTLLNLVAPYLTSRLEAQDAYNVNTRNMVQAMVGHPFTAAAADDMDDTDLIYVYTGTTTATLTNGHWYYWDGTAWTDGGVYNSQALDTDTTLTISGAAADAKAAGDAIREVKADTETMANLLPDLTDTTVNGVTLTGLGNGSYRLTGTCSADTNITFYTSTTSLPDWMARGSKYFALLDGAVSNRFRLMVAGNPGYAAIANANNKIVPFTAPVANGVLVALNIDGGVTFDETFTPVIIAQDWFSNVYMPDKGIGLVVNLLPELASTTVNGLTLTNLGNDQYTLTGTASEDTNITFFTDAGNVPKWLNRGKEYYAALLGVTSTRCRLTVASRPGYAAIVNARNNLTKFTMPSTGGVLVALNIDGGVTYNEKFSPVIIAKSYFSDIYMPKREIIVAADGSGDFSTVKQAVEYANTYEGTTIRILPGSYDLVAEFGDSYLDALSDNNPDYGLYLGNGVKIICSPLANIQFDYDGDNEWVVRNFSPFNTGNNIGYEVEGMHVTAHNCRYIMHDDPLWADKMKFSRNVWRNCYFEIYPSPQVSSWVNHQIIGGGFGYNNLIEIDSCIFNAHYSGVDNYSSVSYHGDVSEQTGSRSRLTIKNCWFANGNRVILEGYGASTVKSEVVVNGNSFKNANHDIVYDSSNADNMQVYRFNNESR